MAIMTPKFSSLFKLSSGRIATAFSVATKAGSIEGIKLLKTPSDRATFIIALTRAIKGSVNRNQIRRRIKAALHTALMECGPLPANIFLCVTYPSAQALSYQQLVTWLKASIWKTQKTK